MRCSLALTKLGIVALLFTSMVAINSSCQETPNSSAEEAAPTDAFGFAAGMTKAEVIASVGRKSVIKDQGDRVWLSSTPVPTEDFSTFVVYVSATKGLAKINAISKRVAIVPDAQNLLAKYNQIRESMETRYGPSTTLLTPSAVWNSANLFSSWMSVDGADITLEIRPFSRLDGVVAVDYEFPNFADWLREHSAWFKFHLTSY